VLAVGIGIGTPFYKSTGGNEIECMTSRAAAASCYYFGTVDSKFMGWSA